MIHPERVAVIRDEPPRPGKYVLYWMQQSQRTHCNHALEYAVRAADELKLPVLVGFGLDSAYPEANLRHFRFMLEGLEQTAGELASRGIGFVLRMGAPAETALALEADAALLVCDRGYLRHQREWRRKVAREARGRVVRVESDLVVPVETASGKAEYAARTLRPKIRKNLDRFLVPLKERRPRISWQGKDTPEGMDIRGNDDLAAAMGLDSRVGTVSRHFTGGRSRALERFRDFMSGQLSGYHENSRRPEINATSRMSPWLHFGQISPLELALEINGTIGEGRDAWLEQLVVRRELAANFTFYRQDYDSYACVPGWARDSLAARTRVPGFAPYNPRQMEEGETRDPYWNAAMFEMRASGFMHTYMRMYWGKKILEWSADPETAFNLILEMNNRWFLDGRDPNSYAGTAWIFGVHDRAWPTRPGFGKVRSMTAGGLERKCDIKAYVQRVHANAKKLKK